MGKKKKGAPQKKQPAPGAEKGTIFLERLETWPFVVGFFVLLFFLLAFLYQPMVFKGYEPSGGDITSNIGQTHQLKQWEKRLGHFPLWNPYMFGGMPTYHRRAAVVWSVDTVLNKMDFLGDWRLWFFLAGALGIFLLVKFLGLSAAAAMLAALAFVLMPHFQALIIVGHFSKFRALMWMPYVVLTALLFLKRRDVLATLLFALALTIQFRTQHYQIMFYTLLAVAFLGIPYLYRMVEKKDWSGVMRTVVFAVAVVFLMVLSSAQNLLSIKEYTPYSTRGGHAISLKEEGLKQAEKKGVGFDYATNWSYSISELWNLIVPKFHGGTSSERYTGNAVPQWKNQTLPTYWGTMPFTQSYEYLGILLVFLALLAVVFRWERPEIKSLTFLTVLALFLALGKHFAALYRLFFYYVPYFDKFRVPMMILTLVMFNVSLLAAFGLEFLLRADWSKKEIVKRVFVVAGVLAALLLIPLLFGTGFSLTRAGEAQRYGAQVVEMLRKVRLDMMRSSSAVSLLFLVVGAGGVAFLIKGWLNKSALALLFVGAVGVNFLLLDGHYLQGKFVDPKQLEAQAYAPGPIERTLSLDKTLYRVFPVGRLFQDVRWSYFYQSLGGYSAAKLQTIQEIVDNCLYVNIEGEIPINWHIVNMMNARYLITDRALVAPHLDLIEQDAQRKLLAYRNKRVLPRAFFVQTYRVIPDGVERLKFLNSPDFRPDSVAVLEKEPPEEIAAPDSARATVTEYQPEVVKLQVYTDKPALLVLSEVFYPKGWKAVLDDRQELEIYKTNHLLRSVVVPVGEHQLTFIFHPRTYYTGIKLSLAGMLIIYLGLLGALWREYGEKLRGGSSRKSG